MGRNRRPPLPSLAAPRRYPGRASRRAGVGEPVSGKAVRADGRIYPYRRHNPLVEPRRGDERGTAFRFRLLGMAGGGVSRRCSPDAERVRPDPGELRSPAPGALPRRPRPQGGAPGVAHRAGPGEGASFRPLPGRYPGEPRGSRRRPAGSAGRGKHRRSGGA